MLFVEIKEATLFARDIIIFQFLDTINQSINQSILFCIKIIYMTITEA
jgi:hypothetical protein